MKIAIIILLCMCMLCGCTKADTTDSFSQSILLDNETEKPLVLDEQSTLTLKVYTDAKGNYLDLLIEDVKSLDDSFEFEIVDATNLKLEDYRTKLATELMIGEGPDLILISMNGTGANDFFPDMTKMAQNHAFMDINSLGMDLSKCNSKVMKAGELNGEQIILPLNYSLGILYTTEEKLKKAGVEVYDGITLNEFAKNLDSFYDSTPDMKVFCNYFTLDFLYHQNALDWIDYNKKSIKEENKVNIALGELCEAYMGLFPDIFNKIADYEVYLKRNQYGDTDSALYTGGAILFNSGRSFDGTYESLNSLNNIYAIDTTKGENPIVLYLPTLDGKGPAPFITYGILVNGNTKSQEAVKKFLNYAISDEIQRKYLYRGLPINTETVEFLLEFYRTDGLPLAIASGMDFAYRKDAEYSSEFIDQYEQIIVSMRDGVYADYNTIDSFFECIYSNIVKGEDIKEGFARAAEKVCIYLSE